MPELHHLPPTTTPADITRHLREDGYVIVDNLVGTDHMDRIATELGPYIDPAYRKVDRAIPGVPGTDSEPHRAGRGR